MFSKGNDVLYTECAVHTPGQLVAVIHHFITTTQRVKEMISAVFCFKSTFSRRQILLMPAGNGDTAVQLLHLLYSGYLYGCRRLRCSPWPAVKLRLIKSAQPPGRERPAGARSTSRASPSCWQTDSWRRSQLSLRVSRHWGGWSLS